MKRELPADLPVNAVSLDASGAIVRVNENWIQFAERNGLPPSSAGVGTNYLEFCRETLGRSHRVTVQLQALLEGRVALISWVYPCDAPHQKRWFHMIGSSDDEGALIAHIEITALVTGREWQTGPVIETAHATLLPTSILRPGHESLREEPLPKLTRRQAQVLLLVRQGKNNAEIATALRITVSVVKKHVSALVKVFGATRRVDLILPRSAMLLDEALPQPASVDAPD
jgi:DNA-binding CsgD family transcriptional regulator